MRALAIVMLLAGVAHAGTIAPPPGWTIDNAQSKALGAQLKDVHHFGLAGAMANVDVYVAPAPGIVLTVTLVGAATATERDAAARAAVDDLHAASHRAQLAGSGIVEDGWEEKVEPAAKQIVAALRWRDTTAKSSSSARIVIVADAEYITAVIGECFSRDDADPKLVIACRDALATLDPGIDPSKRVPLALAPTGTRPTPPEPTVGLGSAQLPASMDDASRSPLPPMTVPQEGRTADRRPVYVGIGLVVLAAAFWWNRHRRRQQDKM